MVTVLYPPFFPSREHRKRSKHCTHGKHGIPELLTSSWAPGSSFPSRSKAASTSGLYFSRKRVTALAARLVEMGLLEACQTMKKTMHKYTKLLTHFFSMHLVESRFWNQGYKLYAGQTDSRPNPVAEYLISRLEDKHIWETTKSKATYSSDNLHAPGETAPFIYPPIDPFIHALMNTSIRSLIQ